jgi:hypothetical protein
MSTDKTKDGLDTGPEGEEKDLHSSKASDQLDYTEMTFEQLQAYIYLYD